MPDIPQIAFPLRVVDGQILEVEQGGPADIAGQVAVLVHTPPGWLGLDEGDPAAEFGLASQEHLAGGADPMEVQAALIEWIGEDEFRVAATERPGEVAAALSRLRIGV